MAAWILAILSIIEFFGVLLLMGLGRALGGMSDGAGAPSSGVKDNLFAAAIFAYLFLMFLTCMPFMRGSVLLNTGIIAHLILLGVFIMGFIVGGWGGFILIIPFAPLELLWLKIYCDRTKKVNQ